MLKDSAENYTPPRMEKYSFSLIIYEIRNRIRNFILHSHQPPMLNGDVTAAEVCLIIIKHLLSMTKISKLGKPLDRQSEQHMDHEAMQHCFHTHTHTCKKAKKPTPTTKTLKL